MQTATSTELESCQKALAANGFDAYLAQNSAAANELFFSQILPGLNVTSFAWGDSLTLQDTAVLDGLFRQEKLQGIRTFAEGVDRRELLERRRRALLVDLFLTGSNAVTLDGKIINLDMIGNRTAPISFGPKKVVLFIGRNKITDDMVAAMERVKAVSAPLNAKRHQMNTPCTQSGRCHDCNSPQRICNSWSIISKCFPPGRIKVVLIDEDLGL